MKSSYSPLAQELEAALRGEVSFGDSGRALYAADASNYRQIPIGVLYPRDSEDVLKAVEICRKHQVPILSRGAGTSLAGQTCNEAVVFDFSRHMNRILNIDPVKKTARVEPGVILDHLRREAEKHGLTFGPDPATHNRCTLGGMIGNNSCGVHSLLSGKTAENTISLRILTYGGQLMEVGAAADDEYFRKVREGGPQAEIYKKLRGLRDRYTEMIRKNFPKLPRRVSGYSLEELLPENGFQIARALVGTEGTCVMVLEAEVKLIENPAFRSLVVLGYPDIYQAADHIPRVLEFKPIGTEGLDEFYVMNMRRNQLHLEEIDALPPGKGWLLVEFGGRSLKEAEEKADAMIQALKQDKTPPAWKWCRTNLEQKKIWALRESSFGATVFVPGVPDTFSGFEDSAVPPVKLGAYLRELRDLYARYDYYAVTYGHFGDGCIHTRLSFDLKTEQGVRKYKLFLEEAADLVVKYGGSLSGEHGDGQTWGHLLYKMYGRELVEAFREFKFIWDPQNKMNPGKVVDSYPLEANLRHTAYAPVETGPLHFDFHEEKGNFARTTERCIGIGRCLKTEEGTMCPSYMVTREEKHSTRGRAHLLHEMMRGEVIHDGWKSEAVKESLDLCLACKACKTECPVKVDMATYKAEFLSHYYEGKLRPLRAYLFGWISVWAKIASQFPAFFNFMARVPLLSKLAKKAAGIASQREIPAFAAQTFRHWFSSAYQEASVAKKNDFSAPQVVILWPDTFTNYFYPEVGKAAVRVLNHAGFEVTLPPDTLCCGRPLYDSGMLHEAKAYLEKILNALRPQLEKGAKVVGLEPSCIAVFKDELLRLFPGDPTALLLNQNSFVFPEFLVKHGNASKWPKSNSSLLVQGHCHQKALIGMRYEQQLFETIGVSAKFIDGCCGMAGSFGFEAGRPYEVSVALAERSLIPEIAKAPSETAILSDGFSCREQIRQTTGKKPLHLAEWLDGLLQS